MNSVVNQMLALMDGVRRLDNVLVVGLTNRRELIDPALLRPGRWEGRANCTYCNSSISSSLLPACPSRFGINCTGLL